MDVRRCDADCVETRAQQLFQSCGRGVETEGEKRRFVAIGASGIPNFIWRVSGYRVLPRWIEGRRGLPADLAFIRELRDVDTRIAELIPPFRRRRHCLE